MNRSDRRLFEKKLSKVLKKAGDVCGICGRYLQPYSQMYGGFSYNYRVVLTSDCCMDKLAAVMYSGIYVNRNVGALLSVLPTLRAHESMPVAERQGSRLGAWLRIGTRHAHV